MFFQIYVFKYQNKFSVFHCCEAWTLALVMALGMGGSWGFGFELGLGLGLGLLRVLLPRECFSFSFSFNFNSNFCFNLRSSGSCWRMLRQLESVCRFAISCLIFAARANICIQLATDAGSQQPQSRVAIALNFAWHNFRGAAAGLGCRVFMNIH